MSQSIQIQVDPRVAGLIEHLAGELPALMASGEAWEITINGAKDGKVYRNLQRRAEIALPEPDARRLIKRR